MVNNADINECEHKEYPCRGICQNTSGSYECKCPSGTHSADPLNIPCNPNFPLAAKIVTDIYTYDPCAYIFFTYYSLLISTRYLFLVYINLVHILSYTKLPIMTISDTNYGPALSYTNCGPLLYIWYHIIVIGSTGQPLNLMYKTYNKREPGSLGGFYH